MPIVGATPAAYLQTQYMSRSIPTPINVPTVYLPLTTTFTVPSQCLNAPKVVTAIPTTFWLQGGYETESCFPTGYPFAAWRMVYSPGICPAGWHSACERTETITNITQNIVSCCPLYYGCASSIPQEWDGNFGCASTYYPEDLRLLDSWSITSGDVYAHSMYQAPIMIVSTTPSSTSTAPPPPPFSSLSKGEIAGIAIGAIVGMAFVVLLALIAWRLRKKRHTGIKTAPADEQDSNPSNAPEVWYGELPPNGAHDRQEPTELSVKERPVEMSVS